VKALIHLFTREPDHLEVIMLMMGMIKISFEVSP